MPVRRLVIMCGFGAAALTGCGGSSDSDQVKSTVQLFAKATAAHDYPALCDKVLAPTLVARLKKLNLPCAEAVGQSLGGVRDPRVEIQRVDVRGQTASVGVKSSAAGEPAMSETVKLVKTPAGWRISSLGGTGTGAPPPPSPSAPPPPRPAQPND